MTELSKRLRERSSAVGGILNNPRQGNVRLGSQADIASRPLHVRFTPKSRHRRDAVGCPLCAKTGRTASQQNRLLDQLVGIVVGKELLFELRLIIEWRIGQYYRRINLAIRDTPIGFE
jgi:hypothetical protein